jgi:hypothetical protein
MTRDTKSLPSSVSYPGSPRWSTFQKLRATPSTWAVPVSNRRINSPTKQPKSTTSSVYEPLLRMIVNATRFSDLAPSPRLAGSISGSVSLKSFLRTRSPTKTKTPTIVYKQPFRIHLRYAPPTRVGPQPTMRYFSGTLGGSVHLGSPVLIRRIGADSGR